MLFLLIVGWLIAIGSVFAVSNATAGVAGICFACFLVITARVAQADRHHREVLALLRNWPGLPRVPTVLERATTVSN